MEAALKRHSHTVTSAGIVAHLAQQQLAVSQSFRAIAAHKGGNTNKSKTLAVRKLWAIPTGRLRKFQSLTKTMPSSRVSSTYRPPGSSRRPRQPPQTDHHDVFDGLPVRAWTKQWIPINPPPSSHHQVPGTHPPTNPLGLTNTDLPLPKETHLLTPMSQALLQAARSGTLEKQKYPGGKGGAGNGTPGQGGQQSDAGGEGQLFLTKKWVRGGEADTTLLKGYLGKMPEVVRKRRRVRRRVEGKIVVSYLDEEGGGGTTTQGAGQPGATQGGATGAAGGAAAAAAAAAARRRPPPKRKPGRGRKPGRKVKFMDEVTQQHNQQQMLIASAEQRTVGGEVKKVVEVEVQEGAKLGEGQVEVMELDPATMEDENLPKSELTKAIEKEEEREERKALEKLAEER